MRNTKKRNKRLKDTQCPQACGHWVSTGQLEIKNRPAADTFGVEGGAEELACSFLLKCLLCGFVERFDSCFSYLAYWLLVEPSKVPKDIIKSFLR